MVEDNENRFSNLYMGVTTADADGSMSFVTRVSLASLLSLVK